MSIELAPSLPSSTLKKRLLLVLESRKGSMDILAKELRIDTTQCKAVCEVVATFEERDGQELSLDKWMSIFQSLGCSEEFERLFEEDLLLDVNTLDNCPPDNFSNHTQETLLKESEELRRQKIKPADGHSRLSESELKTNLPSKLRDNVEETWKTSTAPGNSQELGLPPPLEDETSTELVKDTTTVLEDDDEEHRYPEVGKASESMVSFVGKNVLENSQTNASSLLEEESHSTSQINEDGNLNSGDLRSRSQPVTSNARNSALPIVTGHQFRPNSPKAGEAIAVNQDEQNLQEHERILCAAFSLPLANESSLPANHQFQEGTPSDTSGMDEETDSRSWSQIETVFIPNLDGLSTRSRPVSPDAANYQILPVESCQLHPSNQMDCHANVVDHEGQTLLEERRMLLDAQPSSAGSLPALHARPVVQDPVGQFHQATQSDSYGTNEAEDSSSSSQSDADGSLSADYSRAQSRSITPQATISPQLHLLYPNNLLPGRANSAVMADGPALLENKGMPLDTQLSSAVSVSNLPALHARPAVQDPVGKFHQTIATNTYDTGEAEDSSLSSHSDTDWSVSSDDSGAQSRPITPQATISPQLHLLHPNNLMPGEGNSVVNPDRRALLENRGIQLGAQPSPAIVTSDLAAVHARPVVQDHVDQIHQGMACDTYSTDEAENSSSSSHDFVNHDRRALLENKGMQLGAQLSSAIAASSLAAEHARPAVLDCIGQIHQGMAGDTYSTDEEENSSSSSQSDTDAGLSSDDSATLVGPVMSQATNSPLPSDLGRPLYASNPVVDQANALGQGIGNQPSENDDATQNMNILQQVQPLQFREIAFLIQSLWEKSTKLEARKRDLQHCRQECAELQGSINELQIFLDGSNHLLQENQRLIRMTQEMCDMKGQEIQQLNQLCAQKDQDIERLTVENESLRGEYLQVLHQLALQNSSFEQQIGNLMREREEVSKELRQTVAEVHQCQSQEHDLEVERENLRLDNERLLGQRMSELSEAFHNTQTDQVKILEWELEEEKHKRTEAEETNRCLFEKNCQLQAMVNKLMSRPAELVDAPCSAPSLDTMQENLVSSSTDSNVHVVEADEETDDNEEVYEDALDHL